MKLVQMALVAVLALAAAVVGVNPVRTRISTQPVHASPIFVRFITPQACLILSMAVSDPAKKLPSPPIQCLTLTSPSALKDVAHAVGNYAGSGILPSGGRVLPDDLAAVDLDGNQIHNGDGTAWIVAFVDSDHPVTFRTTLGVFQPVAGVPSFDAPIVNCPPPAGVPDDDCNGDGAADDGVIVMQLSGVGAATGPGEIQVVQDGAVSEAVPFTVVGEPYTVGFTQLETTIQTGLTKDDCKLPTDMAGFAEALDQPEKSVLIARAFDQDGAPVVGALINWMVSDPNLGVLASGFTLTLDVGSFGYGAPNVVCGTEGAGTLTVTATIVDGFNATTRTGCISPSLGCTVVLEPQSRVNEYSTVDYTVVRPPATSTPTATDTATGTPTATDTATSTPTATDTATNTATATPPPLCLTFDEKRRLFFAILGHFGAKRSSRRYEARLDLNHDGFIDWRDLVKLLHTPACGQRDHHGDDVSTR